MISKSVHKSKRGQSLVEFTLVLPFLLLLFIGMVEAGYAMYDYIVLANANREGVRLAARGRFSDENIIERIVGAGGYREVDGVMQANLRATGDDPNLGIIITHIPLPSDPSGDWHQKVQGQACCQPDCPEADPDKINVTQCLQGSLNDAGVNRDILSADSTITDITVYQASVDVTEQINQIRLDEDYDPQQNLIVVVETYMAHDMLLHMPEFFPIPDPFTLYFKSTMRVTLNSRTQQRN